MKKYFFWIYLLMIHVIYPQNQIQKSFGVFPYRVDVQLQNISTLSTTELPYLFQSASIFLLRTLFEYHFLDDIELNEKFQEYKQLSELEARIQINKICSKNYLNYFLVGETYYYSNDYVKIKNVVFSCVTNQKLYETESRGNIYQIQSLLRSNLKKIIPFLPENQIYKKWNSFEEKKEIFLLVDQSGSMETSLPIIKKALQTDAINLYGIIPEKGIQKYNNWDEIHGKGILNIKDLTLSLEQLKRELIPFKSELWIFFDSFQNSKSREIKELNITLKSFSYIGVPIYIFQTYNTGIEEWNQMESLQMKGFIHLVQVKYGRTCGFSNGTTSFFIRRGKEFFLCPEENKFEYIKGTYDLSMCIKMELYMYSSKETNFDIICNAYSQKNNLKTTHASSIISDMDYIIQKVFNKQDFKKTYYKILLKDTKGTFWLHISDKKILNEFLEYKTKNEEFYLGLSFYRDIEDVKAIPDKVVIIKPKDVPKLFLINFKDLDSFKKNKPQHEDMWFFFVKILDIR